MYLLVPSMSRDLPMNLGLDIAVLLTLGSRLGSSKSSFLPTRSVLSAFRFKISRTRFCCLCRFVSVVDLWIRVVCRVPILESELLFYMRVMF